MLLKLINQSIAGLLSKSLWEQNVFLFLHEVSIAPRKNPGVAHEIRCFRTSWVNVKETIYSCWGFVSLPGMHKEGWTVGTMFAVAALLRHYNYFGISV